MPTPIAHTLAGYAATRFIPRRSGAAPLKWLLFGLFIANAPDLDFLPGLAIGRPGYFHSGISHSLGFALLFCLPAAGLLAWKRRELFWPAFGMLLAAYLSHLLLDFLNPDGRPPYGIPFWWPVSAEYYLSPEPVFFGVHHSGSATGTTWEFVQSVLNVANLRAMIYEAGLLAPFVLLSMLFERWRERRAKTQRQRAKLEEGKT